MTNLLQQHRDDRGVVTLTMNRPEVHNALNADLVLEFHETLRELEKDAKLRVLVITGAGEGFCSGADLVHMRKLSESGFESNLSDAHNIVELLHTLAHFSKPTIARVNGVAYGGGLGLIAACDMALGADDARFSFSEIRLGLVPAVIAPYVLASMGERNARLAMLTAEPFDAATAARWNLLQHHSKADALDADLAHWIAALLKGSPHAQTSCKQMIARLIEVDTATRNWTAKLNAEMRFSAEGQEGINAFLERRKPEWRK